jgi:heat shock protein HslJ
MKKNTLIFAATSALLVSCQTIPQDSQTSDRTSYKALGTEPFWSLTLADGVMTFSDAGNEHEVRVTDYESRPSFNGWRYVSKNMAADVTYSECSDGMSEWVYKDTVTVKVDEREYKGCGGGIVPPDTLERTAWRVSSINGMEIPAEQGALISFGDGRMSGSVGCNRLGADYKFSNRAVSFGPVMSTKMACPDPVGKQEYAFVSILNAPASTVFPGDGTMVLTGKDGGKAILMQSI